MNKLSSKQVAGVVLAAIGGVLGVIGVAGFFATPRYPFIGIAIWIALFDLIIPGVALLVLGRKVGPLPPAALPFVLPETKTSRLGRVLLLVGSVVLLVGLLLPWFAVTYTVSGSSYEDFGPGAYDAFDTIGVLGFFFLVDWNYAWAWALFAWLILVVVFGMTSAFVGRKFAWFGISGTLVLALYAILVNAVANQLGPAVGGLSVGFAYGFLVAVIGSALIETGARLKRPAGIIAPLRTPLSLGILLMGLGIVSVVGGFLASISPRAASPDGGIFLMVLGIASSVGGFLASTSERKAPLSPGNLLMVLGIASSVGASFALIFFGTFLVQYDDLFDIWMAAVFFGVLTFVVGMVFLARPSLAFSTARPSVSQ